MTMAHRTDADNQLRDNVIRQIEWEPEIVSTDISVNAQGGVVTLTGYVHSYGEKFAAERAAKKAYGVLGLANDIEVRLGTKRTDPEIAREAVQALETNFSVPDGRIKVGVRDGVVTLEGTVDWAFQRESAEASARSLAGVRGIDNHIQVKPQVSPAEVKAKIEEALRRSAEVDARRISVAAEGETVHLYGYVRSFAEKDEAQRAGWAAPGVARVVSHLAIVP